MRLRVLLATLLCLLLTACTGLFTASAGRQGVSGSLVDFLYPAGGVPPAATDRVPELKLPLRVGLAFVPGHGPYTVGLSEAHKARLLERVKAAFADREFIADITIVPTTYLESRRGFDTLDQIGRLYSLDVMALVSYDQVVHADDSKASLLYWTIVGAYLIKGSRNDVQTFVDTAVFDLPTRRLLFRAPGVDRATGASTLVDAAEVLRKNREFGFERAMEDMTRNLELELDRFVERVEAGERASVSHRAGYTGGAGAVDGALVLLALAGWSFASYRRRTCPVRG